MKNQGFGVRLFLFYHAKSGKARIQWSSLTKKRMGAFCQAVYKMQYTRPSTRSARLPLILPA